MIHGYHVILPAYGFWLPNDPRGSWSEFVRRWELVRFGRAAKSLDRRELDELSNEESTLREEARASLKYPPVSLTGHQARSIALAFGDACRIGGYTLWGLSIMPEHAHLVIARHRFKVEQIVNLLKGASTRRLVDEGNHPKRVIVRNLAAFRKCGLAISGRFILTAKGLSKMQSITSSRILFGKGNDRSVGRV